LHLNNNFYFKTKNYIFVKILNKKTMKKLLLLLTFSSSLGLNAQNLLAEDCSFLTVGNVGTVLTGATAGQGGWYTYVASGAAAGANSNFQVTDALGSQGNVFSITGSATASTTVNETRYLYKDISAAWTARTSGNDIIEAEFDLFTGPVTTSNSNLQAIIYDPTGAKALCGISFNTTTLVLRGLSYYVNGTVNPAGNYFINPPTGTTYTLTANTWYKLGISYVKSSGLVKFKGVNGASPISFQFNGSAAATEVGEIDLIVGTSTGNTVAATCKFDNIIVRATSTDTLLAINSNEISNNTFSISPNPADKFINVSNNENINISEINITDLNGRIVKSQKISNVSNIEINVADLTTGMYLMNINTEKGIVTKKIMKN
jgi:hypothetical protein